jgi:DNA-binding NtrC family response regulator
LANGPALADQLGEPEKQILLNALRQHHGNIKRTAENIELQRSNLYKKLEQYRISQETDG